MSTSPDLGIPYIANQQAQPEVTHNDALNMLIALQKGAIDRGLNTPPGSPVNGDVYILGAAPTGAWSGKANKIAIYTTNAWTFIPGNDSDGANIAIGARHEGLKLWVQDEDCIYAWSGSAWFIALPTFPLSIANGGTGQDTAVEAIDALSVKGADIASAATTNLAAATGDFVDVTGTTTITALGTIAAGVERVVRFTGALTLTHNGTSLILPGGVNIATAAGDVARFRSLGSGNWLCVGYMKASGKAVITPTASEISNTPAGTIAATTVQAAINELDGEKVAKAGDTMTGALTISLASGNSLIVDTDVLVVDATNDRVGIGTASPAQRLDVTTPAGDDGLVINNSSATGGRLRFNSTGAGGRSYHFVGTASGSGFGGGKFIIVDNTAADSPRFEIDSSGNIQVVSGALHMGGANAVISSARHHQLRSYTVGTLPSAATAAQQIYVSDESGGAVPAFSDGANWRRVTDRAVVS